MKKFPIIDLGRCNECRGCVAVAPEIFYYNTATAMMEVIVRGVYPEDLVEEAMRNCPEDCIHWEESVSETKLPCGGC